MSTPEDLEMRHLRFTRIHAAADEATREIRLAARIRKCPSGTPADNWAHIEQALARALVALDRIRST